MAYTIRQYATKSGKRYEVRYRKPDGTPTGKRGFRRKMDADAWAAEHVTTAKAHGTYVDPRDGRATIGELYQPWIAKKSIGRKPSYIDSLERAWRVHVAPKWGGRRLDSITRREVQEWVAYMTKAKSATVVIRNAGILRSICADAVDDGMISRNPCDGVQLPRKQPKRHVYLSAGELLRLADAADRHRTVVLVLGLCGLRWGEMVGLTVGDVDLDRHRLSVRVSATEVDGQIRAGTTKGNDARQVIFPDLLAGPLREATQGRDDDEILFPAPNGGWMRRSHGPNTKSSWFYWAKRHAGIDKPLTFHDLRHTAASLMVKSGANVKAVQRQLGHKSAAMTLDVYADLFDDDLDAVGEAMNELLLRESVGKKWANETGEAA